MEKLFASLSRFTRGYMYPRWTSSPCPASVTARRVSIEKLPAIVPSSRHSGGAWYGFPKQNNNVNAGKEIQPEERRRGVSKPSEGRERERDCLPQTKRVLDIDRASRRDMQELNRRVKRTNSGSR